MTCFAVCETKQARRYQRRALLRPDFETEPEPLNERRIPWLIL
jgi:hypothetical protein